jgi:hypothetical protein
MWYIFLPRKVRIMASVLDTIVEAINKRLIVEAIYQDLPRVMCPHVVGEKKERLNALFFQFAGESKSGLPPEGQWRCIHLDELSNVQSYEGEWHTGPDHSQPQNCVDQIIAEVAY